MRRIMGLDYGERRIGIALGDPEAILAVPLRVLDVKSEKAAIRDLVGICDEYDIGNVVVGLPINMNASVGPMAERAQRFADELAKASGLPVEMWDERLSTSLVERTLLDADMSRAKRKKVRDKLAAQVILQGYLDAKQSEQ